MRRSDIGPYRMLPDWILFSDISPIALKLWCVLAGYANQEGSAWPSGQTLMERCDCSRPTLIKARDELVAIGALEVTQRAGESGGQLTHLYTVVYVRPAGPEKASERAGGDKEICRPLCKNSLDELITNRNKTTDTNVSVKTASSPPLP